MRVVPLLLVAAFATLVHADTPVTVRPETIVIHDPPKVWPKPVKNYARIAPEYSDYAIEHDTATRAWLLLDIDETGAVVKVKLVHKPGAGLDQIAVKQAMKLEFEPARDSRDRPMRTQVLWTIEWPSYWYISTLNGGIATRIPDNIVYVPCKGSGPMHMGSMHPSYRDCTAPPDAASIEAASWVTSPGAVR